MNDNDNNGRRVILDLQLTIPDSSASFSARNLRDMTQEADTPPFRAPTLTPTPSTERNTDELLMNDDEQFQPRSSSSVTSSLQPFASAPSSIPPEVLTTHAAERVPPAAPYLWNPWNMHTLQQHVASSSVQLQQSQQQQLGEEGQYGMQNILAAMRLQGLTIRTSHPQRRFSEPVRNMTPMPLQRVMTDRVTPTRETDDDGDNTRRSTYTTR